MISGSDFIKLVWLCTWGLRAAPKRHTQQQHRPKASIQASHVITMQTHYTCNINKNNKAVPLCGGIARPWQVIKACVKVAVVIVMQAAVLLRRERVEQRFKQPQLSRTPIYQQKSEVFHMLQSFKLVDLLRNVAHSSPCRHRTDLSSVPNNISNPS